MNGTAVRLPALKRSDVDADRQRTASCTKSTFIESLMTTVPLSTVSSAYRDLYYTQLHLILDCGGARAAHKSMAAIRAERPYSRRCYHQTSSPAFRHFCDFRTTGSTRMTYSTVIMSRTEPRSRITRIEHFVKSEHVVLRYESVHTDRQTHRHTHTDARDHNTFCVRFLLPERHQWKPAFQTAAVMLRTPAVDGQSPASQPRPLPIYGAQI